MKTNLLLILIALCACHPSADATKSDTLSTNPLLGNWEFVHATLTASDGAVSIDSSQMRQSLIITPTHYMIVVHRVDEGQLKFVYSMAGSIQTQHRQHQDTTAFSPEIFHSTSSLLWELDEEGHLVQRGDINFYGNKTETYSVKALFKKAEHSIASLVEKPGIGSWNLSGAMNTFSHELEGDKSSKPAKAIRLFTPSHWMSFSMHEHFMETKTGGVYHTSEIGLFPAFVHGNYHADPNLYHELNIDPTDHKHYFYATAKKSNSRQVSSVQDIFRQLTWETAGACNQ